MRHSVNVARSSHKKINAVTSDIEGIKVQTKVRIPVLENGPKKESFNPGEYAKQYRKDHAETIAAKRRESYEDNRHKILLQKQLWYLNKGLVKKPSQASIDKYKLYQDDDGTWFSNS
jgi:hypothetical protein